MLVSRIWLCLFCFFQAEDGIRDLVRSRGLGDVYKRQQRGLGGAGANQIHFHRRLDTRSCKHGDFMGRDLPCLLYTSDAADERSSVDLGGRRIIKQKNRLNHGG